ncbi:MAG: Two-component sensor histidine kinase [Novosphingobium sp.]|nr:Two-component sensor histidine kinase [Novosphingobium sp.]
MIARFRVWLNSLQAHMIGFAFGVIAVMTAMSVAFVVIAGPPQRSPMTVYDISRVIRGLEPAQSGLAEQFTRSTADHARSPASAVERQLSDFLAKDLDMRPDDVRVYLGNRSPAYLDYLEKQAALYAQDGRGSPIIDGTVVAAVRQANGNWDINVRRSKAGLENYWTLLKLSPWLGFMAMIPFSMWFSTRLARPVREFALAAGRVGGRKDFPVPVAGPTEIRIAANALNDMQARIRVFIQERTALVGAIAHDLRTPLNSLRFRIARAPDDLRTAAEGDIRQLDRLINSILEYVESDGSAPSMERIDLTSLLQSLVDDLYDRGIDIALDASPVNVEGDLMLLRRLFANLIDNAVKFASRVDISLTSRPTLAIIKIADNGPGMTDADIACAFDPFFRGERSRSRATGGIGLGLSIAKSVADAHAGLIVLSNRSGGGLEVVVSLPMDFASQSGSSAVPGNESVFPAFAKGYTCSRT